MGVIKLDFRDPKSLTTGYGFKVHAWVSGQMVDSFDSLQEKSSSQNIGTVIRKAVTVYDLLLTKYADHGVISIVAADGEIHHIRIDV